MINLNFIEVKNNRIFKFRWEKFLKIFIDGIVKCVFFLVKGDIYYFDVIGKVVFGIW